MNSTDITAIFENDGNDESGSCNSFIFWLFDTLHALTIPQCKFHSMKLGGNRGGGGGGGAAGGDAGGVRGGEA
jgi:hypothetical protein